MRVRIQAIVEGSNKPVFDFAGPSITIGRDAGCDLPMSGTSNVSGRHAQIALAPDGASLVDLGSTNGTFLNDRRIEGSKKLRKGDYFRLGQTGPSFQVVELDLSGAAQPPAPAFMGTMRERAADPLEAFEREAEHRAPAPRPPTAKPRPAPEPAEPATAVRPVPHTSGQTRLMVVELQKKNRHLMLGVGVAAVALLFLGGTSGLFLVWKTHQNESRQKEQEARQKEQDDRQKEQDAKIAETSAKVAPRGQDVYEKAIPSVVWIRTTYVKDKKRWIGHGTGVLIDRERRLVATAYHVIHKGENIEVFFPRYRDGHLLTTLDQYVGERDPVPSKHPDSILVKIWASDPKLDLAILELPSVPTGVAPLKIASASPKPGAHTIALGAHPQGSGGMWVFNEGAVKEVTLWDYTEGGQHINCMMVSTQNPINHGNSGGPLINDLCEVIGICSLGINHVNTFTFVDVRHIKEVLDKRPQIRLPGW